MRRFFLALIVVFLFCACAPPSFETGTSVVGTNIDATRKIGTHIVRSYPYSQEEMWSKVYLFLEKKGYKVNNIDRSNGFVQSSWIIEKYPPDMTPSDFNQKVYKYCIPPSIGSPNWNGFRYRYRIQIIGITTAQSRVLVESQVETFSWDGSQTWVRQNTNGTLEELFFANLNVELGSIPSGQQ